MRRLATLFRCLGELRRMLSARPFGIEPILRISVRLAIAHVGDDGLILVGLAFTAIAHVYLPVIRTIIFMRRGDYGRGYYRLQAISLFILQAIATGGIMCDHCGMPKQTRAEYLRSFEQRRKKIKKMLAAELSYSEIARALHVSPEAIRRIVERMEGKTNA